MRLHNGRRAVRVSMNQAYRQLGEGLPERRSAAGLEIPIDPKRLGPWIDALPRANPASTRSQLGDAMAAMNQVRLERGQRLTALELLRPVALETSNALGRRLHGLTLPLSPGKAREMEQLIEFDRLLADGYRIAVLELCAPSGSLPLLRGGAVAQAIERALYHCSRCMLHAYAIYQAPPAGSWAVLHALFAFARSHRLDGKPVDEPAEQGVATIGQSYGQALLLALSNPYRFNQREQQELWTLCRDLSLLLKLVPVRPANDGFAIPLDRDEGPGYIPEERADDSGEQLWLDLSALRNLLEQPLAQVHSGPVRLRLGSRTLDSNAELLRRLRGGWGSAATRGHQRLGAVHRLETVFGLTALHFHLAGEDFDSFLRRTGSPVSLRERERHDWTHTTVDPTRVPVLQADVLDQSLGGYRIRWPADQSVKARVGELVGLSAGDDGGQRQWMLGAIRWLRHAGDGSVDAGIELLARRARAVAVRSLDAPADGKPRLRAIQFEPVRDGTPQTLRLAVPTVLETIGGDVEIVRTAEQVEIEVGESMNEQCRNTRVVENAGDYLLVVAERAGGGR